MANPTISQIKLPSGSVYDIKDADARKRLADLEGITGALLWKGTTTTALSDGATTVPSDVYTGEATPKTGDVVMVTTTKLEYVFDGTKWQELGDLADLESRLGDLAQHNLAQISLSTTGTAAAQTFTGTKATLKHSVTQGSVSATGNFTPAGAVTTKTTKAEDVVSKVESTSAKYKVGDGAGSVTAGSAATFTQGTDTFTATVADEVLTLGFTQGTDSFSANTPTAVTLPTFKEQTLVSAVTPTDSSIAIPDSYTFAGTEGNVSVSGSTSGVAVADIEYTPDGTNAASDISAATTASYAS